MRKEQNINGSEPPSLFSVLLFARPTQTKSLDVLETFEFDEGTIAVLAHHADPLSRDQLADWLRRARMCFGREFIVFYEPLQIRERDILSLLI